MIAFEGEILQKQSLTLIRADPVVCVRDGVSKSVWTAETAARQKGLPLSTRSI